jgi:shikimate kinase
MNMLKKNIILIGFIGTGKKFIGKLLAAKINSIFVDFNDLLKIPINLTISNHLGIIPLEIQESTLNLSRKLPVEAPFVLSTPYYFPFNRLNLDYLKQNSFIVLLQSPAKCILERLNSNSVKYQAILSLPDPLESLQKWGEKFRFLYQLDADLHVTNYQKNPEQIIAEIVDKLNQKQEKETKVSTSANVDFQMGMDGDLTGYGSQEFCYLCNAPLKSLSNEEILVCSICNSPHLAFAQCINGHFVCFKCAMQDFWDFLQNNLNRITSTNPESIASELMKHPKFEYRAQKIAAVVATSLLLSLYNLNFCGSIADCEIKITIPRIIIGIHRAAALPGDFKVYYGINNPVVGVGIACAVCGEATPQKSAAISFANNSVLYCLLALEKNKKKFANVHDEVIVVIRAAKEYLSEQLSITWEK